MGKPSKKHIEAQAYGKPLTDRIIAVGGRCMEQVVDRSFAVYFERWLLPSGVGVVAMYSTNYREIFIEATPRVNNWAATEKALAAAANVGTPPDGLPAVLIVDA